jgi:hypothetical protein
MVRKRTSLRRWKARCRLGRAIPLEAILDHKLDRWFEFDCEPFSQFYRIRQSHDRRRVPRYDAGGGRPSSLVHGRPFLRGRWAGSPQGAVARIE